MYNVMIGNSGHVTMKAYICTEIFYLDCCWFTVYNVLVLPDCDYNGINAWKIRSIFFRAFLFLKFTRSIVEREKMSKSPRSA